MTRRCIVCERNIKRRTRIWHFRLPSEGRPQLTTAIQMLASEPKPECHIDQGRWMNTIFTTSRASCRTELQRWTNETIISHTFADDGTIRQFSTWDGESYADEHFCTLACAARQGYASAEHGDRFRWHKESLPKVSSSGDLSDAEVARLEVSLSTEEEIQAGRYDRQVG